jgi:hypothetical protein
MIECHNPEKPKPQQHRHVNLKTCEVKVHKLRGTLALILFITCLTIRPLHTKKIYKILYVIRNRNPWRILMKYEHSAPYKSRELLD